MKRKQRKLPKPLPRQPEEIEALRLYPKLGVADWAEKHRKLHRMTTRFHGRWEHKIAPFLVEPMNSLSNPAICQVTIMACAEGGKSEVGLNFLGWIVDQAPGPTLCVMPTEKDTKKRVAIRIKPLFESSPTLLKYLGGDVKKIHYSEPTVFDNKRMVLFQAWAGSVAAMADVAAQYVLLDETGKYQSIGKEADPVSLCKDRTTTYGSESKMYVCSTPVLEGDLIDIEFCAGDQREWWAKCSYCERYHILKWKNVCIETLDKEYLDASDYENGECAWYICPHCKTRWTESERWDAVGAGRWLPKKCIIDENGKVIGDISITKKRSYRISALMLNPAFRTVGMLASEWVSANKLKKRGFLKPLQNFINSRLGEVWKEIEKVTEDKGLLKHIGNYPSMIVPTGVQMITCGVDVHQDHFWVTVEGWGYLGEVWTLEQRRIETKDTSILHNYDVLHVFLRTPFQLEQDPKRVVYIHTTAIDAGYNTDVVYEFCRMCSDVIVVPVMGADYVIGAPYKVAKIMGGTRIRYDLNVTWYKDKVFRLLFEQTIPGSGYWHLPKDSPSDYLKQLASERKPLPRRANERVRWELKSDYEANHLWDAKVYSTFAGELVGSLSIPAPDQVVDYQEEVNQVNPQSGGSSFWDGAPKLW